MKVYWTELPEGMVWVVVPVGVRAKSEVSGGLVPPVMSCGAETLGLKLVDPA